MPVSPENPFNLTMTHAELEAALGRDAVALIEQAGFVLVPREWREGVFRERSKRVDYSEEACCPRGVRYAEQNGGSPVNHPGECGEL